MEKEKKMKSKASCKDCVMCCPRDDGTVAAKDQFVFPEDCECGAGYEEYPDCAYMCVHFIYDDTNDYIEYTPVGRYF